MALNKITHPGGSYVQKDPFNRTEQQILICKTIWGPGSEIHETLNRELRKIVKDAKERN
jgi:hypothetical protein